MNNEEWNKKKALIEELKREWKLMWTERIDDKVRAEGIANKDFSELFVDKGTVIFATRNFKLLEFNEILEMHKLFHADEIVPSPGVGGWGKFIKKTITSQKQSYRVKQARQYFDGSKQRQQLKKCGRGWLRVTL